MCDDFLESFNVTDNVPALETAPEIAPALETAPEIAPAYVEHKAAKMAKSEAKAKVQNFKNELQKTFTNSFSNCLEAFENAWIHATLSVAEFADNFISDPKTKKTVNNGIIALSAVVWVKLWTKIVFPGVL